MPAPSTRAAFLESALRRIGSRLWVLWVLATADAASVVAGPQAVGADGAHWVGSWATPQQIPEPANALPRESLQNATLRQVVHLAVGGSRIRVRISNAFGTSPLHVL